jgi:hypothetical protein
MTKEFAEEPLKVTVRGAPDTPEARKRAVRLMELLLRLAEEKEKENKRGTDQDAA